MGMTDPRPHQKKTKLRGLFLSYLAFFLMITALLAVVWVFTFGLLVSYGVILPANYAENQLLAAKETLTTSPEITPEMISDLYRYALYTPDGALLAGNMAPAEAQNAWTLTQNRQNAQDSFRFYLKMDRQKEICIVRYTLLAQFSSPILRKLLPYPEGIAFVTFGLAILLEVVLLIFSFDKNFSKKMGGLQNAVDKIKDQDLEFVVKPSGVVEIDQLLFSMDKMKEALKGSLKSQWDQEQKRREQISALAHDIKTPLTVVLGNAELLAETELTEEQKEYAGYIAESARRIEQYLKTLIEISQEESQAGFHKVTIDSARYLEQIINEIKALATIKNQKVEFELKNLPPSFEADPDLLRRALMNVVSNAADRSPERGALWFCAERVENEMCYRVIDSGAGFSAEALERATEAYYLNESERTAEMHSGLGLYITQSIVNLHQGRLEIDNSTVTGGGQVLIWIPISSG